MTGVNRVVRAASPKEKKDSLSSPEEASRRLESRNKRGTFFAATIVSKKRASFPTAKEASKRASKKRGIFSCREEKAREGASSLLPRGAKHA